MFLSKRVIDSTYILFSLRSALFIIVVSLGPTSNERRRPPRYVLHTYIHTYIRNMSHQHENEITQTIYSIHCTSLFTFHHTTDLSWSYNSDIVHVQHSYAIHSSIDSNYSPSSIQNHWLPWQPVRNPVRLIHSDLP